MFRSHNVDYVVLLLKIVLKSWNSFRAELSASTFHAEAMLSLYSLKEDIFFFHGSNYLGITVYSLFKLSKQQPIHHLFCLFGKCIIKIIICLNLLCCFAENTILQLCTFNYFRYQGYSKLIWCVWLFKNLNILVVLFQNYGMICTIFMGWFALGCKIFETFYLFFYGVCILHFEIVVFILKTKEWIDYNSIVAS